jgi:glycosyltransferase involved in cell wall biosynthesis
MAMNAVSQGVPGQEGSPPAGDAADAADCVRRPRVLHFVTGGFSGATAVAADLVRGSLASGRFEPLLVLRRKRQTPPDRVQALRDEGLAVELVPGFAHVASVAALVQACRRFRPDVLVAHGFSEHLWGRYAGLLARVPHLVHVEHNSRERYTRWRSAQARWLAARTDAIVGVSEGVRCSLLALGMPEARTLAIDNGIRLEPFAQGHRPHEARARQVVMAARFARQKDPATLIRAVARLRARGIELPVLLAGGGKAGLRREAERLASSLGLAGQVRFLGQHTDMPGLLTGSTLHVLSTHYEGMPLALVEAMAAGCAVAGSAVPGVRELLRDGVDGRLFGEGDDEALAAILEAWWQDPAQAEVLGRAARARALADFSLSRMTARYEALFEQLCAGRGVQRPG